MPIRINLKEIFASDPQEINVDKLNFNFNKLLELGIGTAGPVGPTGPEGPAGPIGLTGPQGPRGATWWVDSGDPAGIIFPVGSLIDGDLYLDKDNFDVYQYDLATDTWSLQVGISGIINSYLATNGSPFARNFGSTLDNRFIAFAKRSDNNDFTREVNDTISDNGILFLNNFDETTFSNITNLTDKYTSLLSIYPNHSDAYSSSAATNGRHHIELGSLYMTQPGGSSTDAELSKSHQSLKISYSRDQISTPELTPTNDNNFINRTNFSLADPNGVYTNNDSNSLFQFITSKYNIQATTIKDDLSTYFGPWESLIEQGANFTHIQADGLTFNLEVSNINSTIGLVTEFSHSSTRLDTENFFMLDTDPSMKGILFNRKVFALENINILAKLSIGDIDPASDLTIENNASIGDAYKAIPAPTDSLIVSGKIGIGTSTPSVKLHVSDDDELARFEGATANSFITITRPIVDGPSDIAKLGYLNSASFELSNGFATGDIIFSTNSSTKVWIKSDGKFGIGISSPGSKLSVSGNVAIGDTYDVLAAPTNGMLVEGTVGVGTSTPGSKLSVSGNTTIGSSYSNQVGPANGLAVQGRVGLGTTTPTDELHVEGSIRMVDGNEEPDAIMTSNADGVGQWTPFAMIGVPVGAVMPYYDFPLAFETPGSTIPDGWLICDGTNITTTPPYAGDPKYDNLRAKLFNGWLPDLRGTFIVGANLPNNSGIGPNSDGKKYTLFETGGEAEVTLDASQIPAHTHSIDPHTHEGWVGAGSQDWLAGGDNSPNNQTSTYTNTSQNTTGLVAKENIGGGGSHENRPPYYALYYIIKY